MADKIPVRAKYTGADVTALQEYTAGDTIPLVYISPDGAVDGQVMTWNSTNVVWEPAGSSAGQWGGISGTLSNQTDLQAELTGFDNHVANIANPHGLTATQIGLGNVDDTSDLAKPISTATQTALDSKGDYDMGFNAQVGLTYIPVLADRGKMITMNNASPNTVTIPANVSVTYPTGTQLNFMQKGVGATTIAITDDVLSVNPGLTLVLNSQYAVATALKLNSNTWVLYGNLVPV